MPATIKAVGSRIDLASNAATASLPMDDTAISNIRDWLKRYREAAGPTAPDQLRVIGKEIYDWIDKSGWANGSILGAADRELEIAADSVPTAEQALLLSLPWELLLGPNGYFADDAVRPFKVWRRIGSASDPVTPDYRNLSLLFMAASPRDSGPELDFEQEEAAILSATDGLSLSLFVEESGCPKLLESRLKGNETFEAFHFSCHGVRFEDPALVAKFADKGVELGPNLIMETEEGNKCFAPPGVLARTWAGSKPKLVFLSACQSADSAFGVSDAFTAALAAALPNVLGWDGRVNDPDAIRFAEDFYRELAGFSDTPTACALARYALLREHSANRSRSQHWHLGRLWLGPGGGGPLSRRNGELRNLPQNMGFKQLLGAKFGGPRVASALTFVGRRRRTQDALAILRNDNVPGLALLGMGNHGKSSLAARISNRFPDRETVVIYGHYDAANVLKNIVEAANPGQRSTLLGTWQEAVGRSPLELRNAICSLLEGPFHQHPITLIVDDLEQILTDPSQQDELTTVKRDNNWADAIASIILAFEESRGASRLILTSRYDFQLFGSDGRDVASGLARIHLEPFSVRERRKQWRAELEAARRSSDAATRTAAEAAMKDSRIQPLMLEALELADGNPGLQDILTAPLLCGEFDAVAAAILALKSYLNNPEDLPDEANKLFEFFRRMTFSKYKAALKPQESLYLKAGSIFGEGVWPEDIVGLARAALGRYLAQTVPVPSAAIDTVGEAAGVERPADVRRRLVGLGLVDTFEDRFEGLQDSAFLVNRFTRPLVGELDPDDRIALARSASDALKSVWETESGLWPEDARSVEALRLRLLSGQVG